MTITALDPSSALVIIDLQNAIVDAPMVPYTGPEVVAQAVELTRAFHEHRAPVVLVRVTARADGSDAAPGRNEIPTQPASLPEGWDVIVDDLAGRLQGRLCPSRCSCATSSCGRTLNGVGDLRVEGREAGSGVLVVSRRAC